jgi:hypothetical protein
MKERFVIIDLIGWDDGAVFVDLFPFSPFHFFSLEDGRPGASGSLQETGQLEGSQIRG